MTSPRLFLAIFFASICYLRLVSCLIGGNGTIRNYPFMMSVRKLEGDQYLHICGGTLLTPFWVLTAKQCVVNEAANQLITVDNFRIYGGLDVIETSNMDIEDFRNLQRRTVKKVAALAPLEQVHFNDAALFKVEMPFEINEYVRFANVPWIHGVVPPTGDIAQLFDTCVMIGYGCEMDERDEYDEDYDEDDEDEYRRRNVDHRNRLKFAEDSDGLLKAANVTLLTRAEIARLHLSEPASRERVLVAEIPESEVTACDGDFGGPLVCGDDDVLFGIISRGDPEKYVIFTRVDVVSGWIAALILEDMEKNFRQARNQPRVRVPKTATIYDDDDISSACKYVQNFTTVIVVIILLHLLNK